MNAEAGNFGVEDIKNMVENTKKITGYTRH